MQVLIDVYEAIRDFLESGGMVVTVIAGVIFLLWALIIERSLYFQVEHRIWVARFLKRWTSRKDIDSWESAAIRDASISRISERALAGLPMIRTLAALCPLLGLLGTVSGMIIIFENMATDASNSPRLMAAGVSRATIPTMAGMVGALCGVFGATYLTRKSRLALDRLRTGTTRHVNGYQTRNPWNARAWRYSACIVSGAIACTALLFIMQEMILIGEKAITESHTYYFTDFVRVKRQEVVERKRLKPERPAAPEKPPPPLPMAEASADVGSDYIPVSVSAPPTSDFQANVGVGGFAISDSDYLPIVKVQPIYPNRARVLGLEGWVMVRFTITTSGAVKNVVVVESSNSMFERAAVKAAEKFKYKPRVVDGQAIEVHGVLNRITFLIEA